MPGEPAVVYMRTTRILEIPKPPETRFVEAYLETKRRSLFGLGLCRKGRARQSISEATQASNLQELKALAPRVRNPTPSLRLKIRTRN